jgi:hypothetical protein
MKRILFALLLPALLPAQNTSCSLTGTVADPAGALIPNAKVTLTGQANGFVRTTATNRDGIFSYPDLTPADFTISIEAPGFKQYRQTDIGIHADEQRSLGQITLSIGRTTDTVTVTAEAVAVNTMNGERAGTLSGEQLDQIALRGRDIFDAISLMAGVVDISDGRDAPGPGSLGNIYILGGRNDSKNLTVDGVSNLDTGCNCSAHTTTTMDSVAEVKVLMSAYSAENGRNPSSINVITKGGGTQYHGQAAFYFRNEDLNANNYFSNLAGRPRQEYRYNIGNYSIGGPVRLPKVPKNKLFFFFNEEFQNLVTMYAVKTVTVPTALERKGDFSQSVNTNGSKIVVNDPLNNKTAFPGNIIPASRITSAGAAILNLFPSPNYVDPTLANRYNWNYYDAASEPNNTRTETGRIDYAPKQNWQLFGSVSHSTNYNNVPYGSWIAGAANFELTPEAFVNPGELVTLHSTNTITPSLFNEASLSATRNELSFSPVDPSKLDRTKLGITIPQRSAALNPQNLIPDMSFGGIQNYANPSPYDGLPYFNQNTLFSFTDNLSKVFNTHVFKTGIYYEHTQKIQSASTPNRGSISFNQDSNNPNDANNAYANALLGNYDSYTEALSQPQSNYLFTNLEAFFQDDWKLKRNLSISWGVRLYHDPPQYDQRGFVSSFSPSAWDPKTAPVLLRPGVVGGKNVAVDPTTGTVYGQGLIGLFVPGVGNPADGQLIGGKNGVPKGQFQTAPIAVAPRLGFAWDPFGTGRTAIRGGGGVYADRIEGNPTMSLSSNPPAVYSPTTYYGTFSDIAASATSGYLAPTGTVYSLATVPHQQMVYNYNLSIDRSFGSNLVSLGYTGSLGRHLLWERNINAVAPGAQFLNLNPQNKNPQNSSALSTNFLRPYSAYGDVFLYEFANNSNYNGLLASFQHRLSHGINVSASYTYSKALDASDSYNQAVDPFLNPRSRNYGPANYDRRQVFTSSFYYNLPKPGKALGIRPLGWVTDNWELSGVVRILTGAPLTPGYSLITGLNSPTGTPSDTARLQVVNPTAPLAQRFGPPPEPAGQATAANAAWLSTSTDPQFGNLGKNTLTGPGTNNCDLSLYRVVPLREGRVKAMFRFETYNTLNHTQFNAINTTAQFNTVGTQVNAAFLTPTAARPPRIVQLAMRVTF